MGKPLGPCALASRKLLSVRRRGQDQVKARRGAQRLGGLYLPQAVVGRDRVRSFAGFCVIPGPPSGIFSELRRDGAKDKDLRVAWNWDGDS